MVDLLINSNKDYKMKLKVELLRENATTMAYLGQTPEPTAIGLLMRVCGKKLDRRVGIIPCDDEPAITILVGSEERNIQLENLIQLDEVKDPQEVYNFLQTNIKKIQDEVKNILDQDFRQTIEL